MNFPKLVLAGGQIVSFVNSGWPSIIEGEMNVISNSTISAADDTSPRAYTINARLTGNGGIRYHAYNTFTTFQAGSSASLNVANSANTFTGPWNVELGALVGSALNALGTNSITVGTEGALQATYDINNPAAELVLNGRFYLTQNHTFGRVFVNGNQLSPDTYTYAELASAYPINFPATWTGLTGALTATAAAGSITVLEGPPGPADPGVITIARVGSTLQLEWTNSSTLLLTATNVTGPWTTNTGATSPYPVTNNVPQKFYRLQAP
jgi:hypothetical protein